MRVGEVEDSLSNMKLFILILALIIILGSAGALYYYFGPVKVNELKETRAYLDDELSNLNAEIETYINNKLTPPNSDIPEAPKYAYYLGSEGPYVIHNYAGSGTKGIRTNYYYRYKLANIVSRGIEVIDDHKVYIDYTVNLVTNSVWKETDNPQGWITSIFHNDSLYEELDLLTYFNKPDDSSPEFCEYVVSHTKIVADDDAVNKVIADMARILNNTNTSQASQKIELTELQNNIGVELFSKAVRVFPVYDEKNKTITTFDKYIRSITSQQDQDIPFYKDPVGSGVDIFFNPSTENIERYLGIK